MAGSFASSGAAVDLAHLAPRPTKDLFGGNYLNIANNDFNFAKQFLPEVYEKEIERYGNRTVSGFLRMVGAEMPMASDEVVWSEQGRIHVASNNATYAVAGGVDQITLVTDTDSNGLSATNQYALYSVGDTLVVSQGNKTAKVRVNAKPGANVLNVRAYSSLNMSDAESGSFTAAGAAVKLFIYGSEYAKNGDNSDQQSVDAPFTKFTNKPIILKGKYSISGSDTAQIGWVEVATEAGASGY